ncbi:MAG: hypothetical protein FJ109_02530 [Deltaproteobacteria bacterium]|nr:hypothetical protein [Deltaproteobacteria bacterium]
MTRKLAVIAFVSLLVVHGPAERQVQACWGEDMSLGGQLSKEAVVPLLLQVASVEYETPPSGTIPITTVTFSLLSWASGMPLCYGSMSYRGGATADGRFISVSTSPEMHVGEFLVALCKPGPVPHTWAPVLGAASILEVLPGEAPDQDGSPLTVEKALVFVEAAHGVVQIFPPGDLTLVNSNETYLTPNWAKPPIVALADLANLLPVPDLMEVCK